ncbi:MAG: hypothetical protein ACRCXT_02290 [Paraclostridium sp.]
MKNKIRQWLLNNMDLLLATACILSGIIAVSILILVITFIFKIII